MISAWDTCTVLGSMARWPLPVYREEDEGLGVPALIAVLRDCAPRMSQDYIKCAAVMQALDQVLMWEQPDFRTGAICWQGLWFWQRRFLEALTESLL